MNQAEEVQSPPQEKHEAFVKNLPFSAGLDEIGSFFQGCGKIENINLLKNYNGTSKGTAFVRFSDRESLDKAIEFNGKDFGGRALIVEAAQPKEQRSPTRTGGQGGQQQQGNSSSVFVGNLSYSTSEEGLKDLFKSCGNIKAVRIAKDDDGKMRGFAHIDFETSDEAEKAVALTGQDLDGRTIRVDFSSNKRQGGGGFRGGRGGGFRGGFRGGSRGGYGGGSRGGYGGDRSYGGDRGGYGGDGEGRGGRGGSRGGSRGDGFSRGGFRGARREGGL